MFESENADDTVFEVRDGVTKNVKLEDNGDAVVSAQDRAIIILDDPVLQKFMERSDVEDRGAPSEMTYV